jgi:hypothetical protein
MPCSQRPVWLSILLVLVSCSHVECFLQPSHPSLGRNTFSKRANNYIAEPFSVAVTSSNQDDNGMDVNPKDPKLRKRGDLARDAIQRLAELSLQDYKWRSNLFKTTEAERLLEKSLARMTGEDAAYFRPMNAADNAIGPLGCLEKAVVEWLSNVIDEEGRRAQRIVNSDGQSLRPMDAGEGGDSGPLASLEKRATDFIHSILQSERERVRTGTLRPKDLEETVRGPFGELEMRAVFFLQELEQSEKLRMQQSLLRSGEVIRPIDVPGPLGEIEMAISDIFYAEGKRALDLEKNPGMNIRPKDARFPGPFGETELTISNILEKLRIEESERLRNIKRVFQDNRPMDKDSNSFLGVLETVVVGLARGPQLLASVFKRVQELLSSEKLDEADMDIVKERERVESSSSQSESDDSKE